MYQQSLFESPADRSQTMTVPDDARLIILLDLNYTLVANSELKKSQRAAYDQKILSETYREWLIDLVRPHYVILATVRKSRYQVQTLERIRQQTGWQPHEAYFSNQESYDGGVVKRWYLERYIFPQHGRDARYYAIESANSTKRMYTHFGIPAISVNPKQPWDKLPPLRI